MFTYRYKYITYQICQIYAGPAGYIGYTGYIRYFTRTSFRLYYISSYLISSPKIKGVTLIFFIKICQKSHFDEI